MRQKLRLLAYFVFVSSFSGFAQLDYLSDNQELESLTCTEKVRIAENYFRGYDSIAKNVEQGFKYLTPCLAENNAEAQHLYGLLYIGAYDVVPRNYEVGFEYIEKAAQQGNVDALCNLAILYKRGKGCDIDFDKSIEIHEEAFELGNTKSAHKLGYMYFKGLGSIDQDYEKAIEWFTKSEYPFSDFFLGVCYYYGYGVEKDQAKALEIVGACTLPGCQRLYQSLTTDNHVILNEDEIENSEEIQKELKQAEQIVATEVEDEEAAFEIGFIDGSWEGKLVEFDWSNSKIVRNLPAKIDIKASENTITEFKLTLQDTTQSNLPVVVDNNLSFSNLSMNLERLYKDALGYDHLDYKINSMNAVKKRALGIDYLVLNLDTYVKKWKEPGPPMQFILQRTLSSESQNSEILSEEIINALAEDTDGFIKLYPNPFETNLLIEYELEETSNVTVEVYNYLDQTRTVLEAGELQIPEKYTYNLNGNNLKDGLYIVKVTANDQVHSKLIVKGN